MLMMKKKMTPENDAREKVPTLYAVHSIKRWDPGTDSTAGIEA